MAAPLSPVARAVSPEYRRCGSPASAHEARHSPASILVQNIFYEKKRDLDVSREPLRLDLSKLGDRPHVTQAHRARTTSKIISSRMPSISNAPFGSERSIQVPSRKGDVYRPVAATKLKGGGSLRQALTSHLATQANPNSCFSPKVPGAFPLSSLFRELDEVSSSQPIPSDQDACEPLKTFDPKFTSPKETSSV
ncbi:MAG: hypothetical protein SGPRY_006902 [Prymnesium sp.]